MNIHFDGLSRKLKETIALEVENLLTKEVKEIKKENERLLKNNRHLVQLVKKLKRGVIWKNAA